MKKRITRWFHYTTNDRLEAIERAGEIRLATSGLEAPELPAVWATRRPSWEPTATKGNHTTGEASIEAMLATGILLVRLGLPKSAVPWTWVAHKRFGMIDPGAAYGLARAARSVGSDPRDWRLSYVPIPFTAVLAVEVSADGRTWRSPE